MANYLTFAAGAYMVTKAVEKGLDYWSTGTVELKREDYIPTLPDVELPSTQQLIEATQDVASKTLERAQSYYQEGTLFGSDQTSPDFDTFGV